MVQLYEPLQRNKEEVPDRRVAVAEWKVLLVSSPHFPNYVLYIYLIFFKANIMYPGDRQLMATIQMLQEQLKSVPMLPLPKVF